MRFVYALAVTAALSAPAAAATLSDAAVSGVPGWNVSQTGNPPSAQVAAVVTDPTDRGRLPRPRATRALVLTKGADRAGVLYLEYASDREARRALVGLRGKLYFGEGQDGPRLLRATNVVALVDARTLSVTMAVSQQLATVGSVQDAADTSDWNDVGSPKEPGGSAGSDGDSAVMMDMPQIGALGQLASGAPAAGATPAGTGDPALQAQVAEGLGKYAAVAAEAGQLLQSKRYREALAAYRRYLRQVDADRSAKPMARWDAASGVGLSAAYSGQMAEARKAFLKAIPAAARLDPRKLAETYFNLACAEAELGQRAAALQALRSCLLAAQAAGPERTGHYQEVIRSDRSLRSLQGLPQLKQILAGK